MLDSKESWLEILGKAQPLYATAPTPGAKNELAKVEIIAKQLGTPLLPWQRYFIRVATELNPDGSYRYQTVLLTVPRQSGKTTVVRDLLTTRSLLKKRHRAFLTAQTGKDARERLFDLSLELETSVLKNTITTYRAAGAPRITFHTTGSRIDSFSPTPESLHGYNFSDGLIDECFKFDDEQGQKLIGAMMPAMQTHKDRQLIMVSTKGTAESTFLNKMIARGRIATTNPDAPNAYFEWGLADGLDPMDSNNWDFHPGLQGGLITKDVLHSAAVSDIGKSEFTRGYMNRYTETTHSIFDLGQWDKLQGPLEAPKQSQLAFAYEVAPDRSKAAIVTAWKVDGVVHLKLIRNDAGTSWLKPTLMELGTTKPMIIGTDKIAANNVTADSIMSENATFPFKQLTTTEFATACVAFRTRVEDGTIKHGGELALRTAISTALTRSFGDSGWVFSHNSQPELIAAIVACRLVDETKVIPAPETFFFD